MVGELGFLRDLAELFSRKAVLVLVGLEVLEYRQKSELRDPDFNIGDVFLNCLVNLLGRQLASLV